jgi:hypothetical protein
MIAGTPFIMLPDTAVGAMRERVRGVVTDTELAEIEAQCTSNRAACLACDDGAIVVTLEPREDGRLEMFVWLAVAFRHGAFNRQSTALQVIARDLGAETIGFYTRRRGWTRRLGPEWSRRGGNEFVRSVV